MELMGPGGEGPSRSTPVSPAMLGGRGPVLPGYAPGGGKEPFCDVRRPDTTKETTPLSRPDSGLGTLLQRWGPLLR